MERDSATQKAKAMAVRALGEDEMTWEVDDGETEPTIETGFTAEAEVYEPHEEQEWYTDLDEAEIDSYIAAQHEEAEASAMIADGQRTFRQAREAQSHTRLSRGFYGTGQQPAKGWSNAGVPKGQKEARASFPGVLPEGGPGACSAAATTGSLRARTG